MVCKRCQPLTFEKNSQQQQIRTSGLSLVRGAAHLTAAQHGRLQGEIKAAQHQNNTST